MRRAVFAVAAVVASSFAAATPARAQAEPTYSELTQFCPAPAAPVHLAPPSAASQCDDSRRTFCATPTVTNWQAAEAACPALTQLGGGARTVATQVSWVPAVTDFLLARAQAEVALFLQERVTRKLCKGNPARLAPQTCGLLNGRDASEVSLVALPSALRADLNDLPRNLLGLVRAELEKRLSTMKPPVRRAACHALAAWQVYPTLRDRGPLAALAELGAYQPVTACAAPLELTLAWARTLQAVIGQVVPGGGSPVNTAALRAALELKLRSEHPTGLPADLGTRLDAALPSLVELIHLIVDIDRHGGGDRPAVARALQAATDAVVTLLERDTDLTHVMAATAALAAGRYVAAVSHLAALSFLGDAGHGALAPLLRFGGLVAALAEARSDEEVRAALDAAAAPLGSHRAFRREWVLFVSGHAGVAAGGELGSIPTAATLAPVLPVGLEVGGPVGCSTLHVLVAPIDLGAVAAVRLTQDEPDTTGMDGDVRRGSEPGWAGVVAPGLFASVGVGDSPFVIGAGAQYLPATRAVFDCAAGACDNTRAEPVFRVMGYIGIDLPVIRLSR